MRRPAAGLGLPRGDPARDVEHVVVDGAVLDGLGVAAKRVYQRERECVGKGRTLPSDDVAVGHDRGVHPGPWVLDLVFDAGVAGEASTPEQREKAKSAKTPEEILALAQEEGYKLSIDELDAASGGWDPIDHDVDTSDPRIKQCGTHIL